MQSAKHLAAAAKGGGPWVSEINSNSNRGKGAVTNLRRCAVISVEISVKLGNHKLSENATRVCTYFLTSKVNDFRAASWTRFSTTGDLSLNKSFSRVTRLFGRFRSATAQIVANFFKFKLSDSRK
jgi:hypothetical protein